MKRINFPQYWIALLLTYCFSDTSAALVVRDLPKRQHNEYSVRIIVPTSSTTWHRGQTVSVDWDATRITPPYTPWQASSCEFYIYKRSGDDGTSATRFSAGSVPCGYGTVWFTVPLDAEEGDDWQARLNAFSEPRHAMQGPFAGATSQPFAIAT
ncbi:hypothetical protein HDV00_005170 [Rhizophlyctis rosea]|nr:hypothetical protein HDV00_005170 [Rhizophlyctis rosea]